MLVTPLQLANAYATFANGGTLFQPRLADEVTQSSAGLPQGQFGHPVDPTLRAAGQAHDRAHARGARPRSSRASRA